MEEGKTLLDKAREIAGERRVKEEQQAKCKKAELNKMYETLNAMKDILIVELKKLDGQQAECGEFRINIYDLQNEPPHYQVIAILQRYRDGFMPARVAWFKADVISGLEDLSDDCRNVPYTVPRIWARFYSPGFNGKWDFNEECIYHGGFTIECSAVEKMESHFFKSMAEQISKWL